MATVFKLRWNTTDCLLNSTAATGIKAVKWYPAAGSMDGGPVTESMDFLVHGSSDDNLATHIQALDGMRKRAYDYMHDATVQYPVWLHAKMDGGTGERRSLVRLIDMSWQSDPVDNVGFAATNKAKIRLTIEREPWWERTAAEIVTASAEVAGASLVFDYTAGGDIVGDVAARIEDWRVGSDTSGAHVGRLWMGLRSANKHGTVANFVPIWELENGTNNPSESGVTDDNTTDVNGASPGGGSGIFVKLTETDLDWDSSTNGGIFQEILSFTLQNASANESDQYGDFLWLLRHKLAANATTWEVQLRWGYSAMANADFVQGPIVELSNTSWDVAQMGTKTIPLRNLHVFNTSIFSDASDLDYTIQVWGRRTSGSADLYLDCLCPIPIDEGWLKSWGFDLPAAASASWYSGESPNGEIYALAKSTSGFSYIPALASHDFKLPVGDGRLVCVYAEPSASDITTGIIFSSSSLNSYYARWANLRGGE